MLPQLMYQQYTLGTLEEWIAENHKVLENSPEWKDGKVAVLSFHCDNIVGAYAWHNCPFRDKRMNDFVERTGYQRTIQTVRVMRWVKLETYLKECMQKDIWRRKVRFGQVDELKVSRGC